jgi:hypothetical protein
VQSLLAFAMTERGGAGSKSPPVVSELAPTGAYACNRPGRRRAGQDRGQRGRRNAGDMIGLKACFVGAALEPGTGITDQLRMFTLP